MQHQGKRSLLVVLSIALLVGLSACGTRFLSSRAKNPVVEDYLSASMFDKAKYGTLSTTAGRRIVLVHMESGKFCAEPPPDAAENVSSSIAAALSASLPSLGNTEAAASFASNFASALSSLFIRSQGVQFARDEHFVLCNAYLNDPNLTHEMYLEQLVKIRKLAKELIDKEIEKRGANWGNISAGVATVTQAVPPAPPLLPGQKRTTETTTTEKTTTTE